MKIFGFLTCGLIVVTTFLSNAYGATHLGKVALRAANNNYIGLNSSSSKDVQAYHSYIKSYAEFDLYAVDWDISCSICNTLKYQNKKLQDQVDLLTTQVSLLKKEVNELRSWAFVIPPED